MVAMMPAGKTLRETPPSDQRPSGEGAPETYKSLGMKRGGNWRRGAPNPVCDPAHVPGTALSCAGQIQSSTAKAQLRFT